MKSYRLAVFGFIFSTTTFANVTVPIHFLTGEHAGKPAGSISIQETRYGLLFTPNLKGLKPGLHGFHIHQNPTCDLKGMAAGGHFDPKKTNKHLGPYNDQGHLGDLPVLYVDAKGMANIPVLAPKLKKIKMIMGHSIMVHEGGDNYSDSPEKLGGGGHRVECGIIQPKFVKE